MKTVPHIAFEVNNMQEAIKGKKVIIEPNSPSCGVLVAFIRDNGEPIGFLEVDSKDCRGRNLANQTATK